MRRFMATGVVLIGVLLPAGLVSAQNRAPATDVEAESGKVILSWEEFVKITGFDAEKKEPRMLTIPWSEVEALLGVKVERVGQETTVALPWQEFKALLEWSVQRDKKPEVPPPTDFLVASSEYTGMLTDDGAEFTLKMKLEILRKKGWKRIPILPATVALTDVTLEDGVYINADGQAYELLTERTGPVNVTCQFSAAVEKVAGINRLVFPRVVAGSSVLDLTVDRADVEVKVANAQKVVSTTAEGKTHVAAALPTDVPLSVSWERALPKVAKMPTKLYSETRTLVAVAEGILVCQEGVSFNILHTPVRELKLDVPANVSVLTVTGSNVQDWRISDAGELTVVLGRETIGSYELSITYERLAKESLEIPVIRAAGVERERGYVSVVALANVEIQGGEITGARSIDVRQLPSDILGMTSQPILLAYRYVEPEFKIPLTVKKHGEVGVLVTIVDSELFTAMQLNDGRRITKALYSVRNNRNQFLRLRMPKGAEIWSVAVSGKPVTPALDKEDNLLIPLVRSTGAGELASFPVEIVYVESPEEPAKESGTIRVDLPESDVPVMQVMYDYYLPREGDYEGGWFTRRGFKGQLRKVSAFTQTSTGTQQVIVNSADQVRELQQQFDQRMQRAIRTGGGTPMKVKLPITGKNYKLERILVLPQDRLWFELTYSNWDIGD